MPFAWIVIVILWWSVSAIMRSRKEAEAKAALQKSQRASQKNVAADQPAPKPAAMSRADEWEDEEDAWDERDAVRGQRQPVAPTVTAQAQAKPKKMFASEPAAKPFEAHMHTPVMGVQGVGTEGIDCCHDFMLGGIEASEPAEFLPMQEEEPSDRAKALLQGVIYSEILGRRPVKHYQMKQS